MQTDTMRMSLPKRIGEGSQLIKQAVFHTKPTNTPSISLDVTMLSKTEAGVGVFLFKYIAENTKKKLPAFWKLSGLYSKGILDTLTDHGFYKRKEGSALGGNGAAQSILLIKDNNGIIEQVTPEIIKAYLLELISAIRVRLPDVDNEDVELEVFSSEPALKDLFLKRDHLEVNEKREVSYLQEHQKELLRDSRTHTYILFKNGVMFIDKNGAQLKPYDDIGEKCVWKHQIHSHELNYLPDEGERAQYAKFLLNVSGKNNDRYASLITVIGYLVNAYNDPTKSKAVMFYDKEETDTDNPEGGTGKGVCVQGVQQVREVVKLDGKNFMKNGQFMWQAINTTTQAVWIDDPKTSTPFESFHSVITDGFNIEKKNQAQIYIRPEDSPKLIFTSNSVMIGDGNTNKRRQFIFEFDGYYKDLQVSGVAEPIASEHNGRFFSSDWDVREWNLFFSFMIDATVIYHAYGLKPAPSINVERNRLIQATNMEFVKWAVQYQWKHKEPTSEVFTNFQIFTSDENTNIGTFSKWVTKYGKSKGVDIGRMVYETKRNYIINTPEILTEI